MRRSQTSKVLGWVGTYLLWIILTLVTLLPIYWMIVVSGRSRVELFDAPTLQYWAAREGNGQVQVVGPVFMPEKYAIAVGDGSALRKPINQALLQIMADGSFDRLRADWFAQR